MYRFKKAYSKNGCNISPGITLKGDIILGKDCLSIVGSYTFKDIPMEYLEEYTPVSKAKIKTPKKLNCGTKPPKKANKVAKSSKTGNESARISDKPHLL